MLKILPYSPAVEPVVVKIPTTEPVVKVPEAAPQTENYEAKLKMTKDEYDLKLAILKSSFEYEVQCAKADKDLKLTEVEREYKETRQKIMSLGDKYKKSDEELQNRVKALEAKKKELDDREAALAYEETILSSKIADYKYRRANFEAEQKTRPVTQPVQSTQPVLVEKYQSTEHHAEPELTNAFISSLSGDSSLYAKLGPLLLPRSDPVKYGEWQGIEYLSSGTQPLERYRFEKLLRISNPTIGQVEASLIKVGSQDKARFLIRMIPDKTLHFY